MKNYIRLQLEKENSDFKKNTIHQHVPKLSQDESQSIEGILTEQKTLMFLKKKFYESSYDLQKRFLKKKFLAGYWRFCN